MLCPLLEVISILTLFSVAIPAPLRTNAPDVPNYTAACFGNADICFWRNIGELRFRQDKNVIIPVSIFITLAMPVTTIFMLE
jgi:hypothetical protein